MTPMRALTTAVPSLILLLATLSAAPGRAAGPLLPAGPEVRLDGRPFYAPDGRLLVGSSAREAPGSDLDTVVRFYTPDGRTPLGPEIRVHARRAGDQFLADVAFAADGSFAVLWTHHQDPATYQVYWRRFGPDGAPLGPEARGHGPIERNHFAGRIAAAPGGGWLLTWTAHFEVVEDPREPLSLYHLVARRFRADGSPLTTAIRLTARPLELPEIWDLAVAPDGTGMIVFNHRGLEFFSQVGACGIGADAALGCIELTPEEAYTEEFPEVEARDDGGFVAVWSDGVLGGIALRRIEADGQAAEPVVIVPAVDLAVTAVAAARLPGDRLLVVWAEGSGDLQGEGVYGRLFTTSGIGLSEAFRVHLAPLRGEGVLTGVAVHPDGSALVRWSGGIRPRSIPLARRLETGCTSGAGGPGSLCLQGGRFRVDANWAANGTTGPAEGVKLTPDTGYLLVLLTEQPRAAGQGARRPAGQWPLLDLLRGGERRRLHRGGHRHPDRRPEVLPQPRRPPGERRRPGSIPRPPPGAGVPEPVWDGEPAAADAAAPPVAQAAIGCPTAVLCLLGRFEVEVAWQDFAGNTGAGSPRPLTTDAGAFWLFQDSNLELLVKMLDGRPLNGRFWLFYGALSNVGYTLRVLDRETGAVRTYINPAGRLSSFSDTAAF